MPKKSCAARSRLVSVRGAALLASALLVAFAASTASAQVLYKWTDEQGRVQYSDRPPKDFKGPVTRVEPPDMPPAPPAVPPPVEVQAPAARAPEAEPATDIAGQRRATRTLLQARVDSARENLEAHRKALADGGEPLVDERQMVQRPAPANLGKPGTPQRSNCRVIAGPEGHSTIVCPSLVPTSEYYDRIQQLEEAVRRAEEALAEAESAYRRGVD